MALVIRFHWPCNKQEQITQCPLSTQDGSVYRLDSSVTPWSRTCVCLWTDKAAGLISEPPALPVSALFTSSLSSSLPPFLTPVFPFGSPLSPRATAAARSSSPPVVLPLRLYSPRLSWL